MHCRSIAGAIVCGPRLRCATAGCRGNGLLLCDYPVKRRGRDTTCNRRICSGCAVNVGADCDYCPPHARVHAVEVARLDEERKFRAMMAEFRPVGSADPEEA